MNRYSMMKWGYTGDLMVSMATAGPVEDKVWTDFVTDLRNRSYTRHLAAATGAVEVSSIQRKLASEAFKLRSVPVAVVTDEALVRGIVTAVSWMGVNIRSYTWADLKEALTFLKIPAARENEVNGFISALKSQCITKA